MIIFSTIVIIGIWILYIFLKKGNKKMQTRQNNYNYDYNDSSRKYTISYNSYDENTSYYKLNYGMYAKRLDYNEKFVIDTVLSPNYSDCRIFDSIYGVGSYDMVKNHTPKEFYLDETGNRSYVKEIEEKSRWSEINDSISSIDSKYPQKPHRDDIYGNVVILLRQNKDLFGCKYDDNYIMYFMINSSMANENQDYTILSDAEAYEMGIKSVPDVEPPYLSSMQITMFNNYEEMVAFAICNNYDYKYFKFYGKSEQKIYNDLVNKFNKIK